MWITQGVLWSKLRHPTSSRERGLGRAAPDFSVATRLCGGGT